MDNAAFLDWLHQAIPLTEAMQIDCLEFDGRSLSLSAPLAPNINDKGTGFAAATSGLATLSGWALITRWLESKRISADVMIAKSEVSYYAPVTGRFTSEVSLPEDSMLDAFWQRFEDRGRARLSLSVCIGPEEQPQLVLNGDYAVVRR